MFWKKVWRKRRHLARLYNNVTRKKITRAKLFSTIALVGFVSVIAFTVFAGIIFAYFAKDLPSPDKVVRREGFSTQILDRNGKMLYEVFEGQKRTPVTIDQIPKYLQQATVAIEDKNFYLHQGFDPTGYLRAGYNLIRYRSLSGGSTLTQQLVKNVLLTSERTIPRKIKEFILTLEIEKKYSKDQILQMYLNEAPYGGTAWGVQAAAELYFNKKVSDLNLVECAFMAGLPQRPSYYSPFFGESPDAYKWRTEQVLRRMREDGIITADLESSAKKEIDNLKFVAAGTNFKAPHFVMYVKKLLTDKYGEKIVEQGGLRVTTTLDLDLQEAAQQIVTDEIKKVETAYHITNGAAVVLKPQTGEILAMVGSKNYSDPNYDGKVNVVLSLRQPGSTIKPVTYVTAFKKNFTPASMLMDVSTSFPGGNKPEYVPVNYDGKEHGPMQLRYALGNSINIVAVKLLSLVGPKDMLQTAYDMGFPTLEPTAENLNRLGLSVTLGGGEVRLIDLAGAYSAFANGGLKTDPVAILKVITNDGKVLEEYKSVPGKRIITPEQAYLINNILYDNEARKMTFGNNSTINISDRQVAVKTGTTNDRRDNWTIGWTPSFITGVWVGNNDNSQMKQLVSGVSGAAPIWRKIILKALDGKPKEDFPIPENIVTAEVDSLSGYRAHDGFPSRVESLIKGTESQGEDPIHSKLKVCKSSGNLATSVDIARGDYEEKEYFILKESDPFSKDGEENRWQKGIDAWVAAQADWRYHPPTDYCDSQNQVDIKIKEPADHSQLGTSLRISLEATSTNNIALIEIIVDGSSRATINSKPYELNLSLPDGPHNIKAKIRDDKGNEASTDINIGVNVPWDWKPSPTPTPSPVPTSTSVPTMSPTSVPTITQPPTPTVTVPPTNTPTPTI